MLKAVAGSSGGGGSNPTGPAGGDLSGDYPNPTVATLENATGLPVATGISGLGTGIATFLATPSSANLATAVTDETGTGVLVFSASPALTGVPTAPTATLGTNTTQLATTAFVLANASAGITQLTGDVTAGPGTGSQAATLAWISRTASQSLAIGTGGTLGALSFITPGTGVATALAVNVGSAGAFVTFNGAGGTPSSLVGTNITGTAAGLTAGTVTTNANLTGPITSVGNATSIASQTGTGTKFVVDTGPTIVGMTNSGNGAASSSSEIFTGTLFTGGSGTTTFPQVLFQPTGTTAVTTWSTSGTALGMNLASGFTGNVIDIRVGGNAASLAALIVTGTGNAQLGQGGVSVGNSSNSVVLYNVGTLSFASASSVSAGQAVGDTIVGRAAAATLRLGAADVTSAAVAQTLTFQGNTASTTNGPLALIRGAGGGSSTSVGGELRLSGGLSSAAAGTGGAVTIYTAPAAAGATAQVVATFGADRSVIFSGAVNAGSNNIAGGNFTPNAGSIVQWIGRSGMRSAVDGNITLLNNAETGFTSLLFGGTTSSFPALKRSTTTLQARLADDSGPTTFQANIVTSAKTTGFSITPSDTGTAFNNNGAAGSSAGTLPAATVGLVYEGFVAVAQTLQFTANGADIIYLGSSVSSAGGNVSSSTIGSKIRLVCEITGKWSSLMAGTWASA